MSKKFLTPIKLAQGASNPAVGSAGELFFNTTDVKVYAHNGTSWVPSGGGVTVSATAPATPIAGDAWYDTVDGTLYVYYNDGDSSQWVEVAANSGISVALEGRVGVVETYVTTLQSEMDAVEANITTLQTTGYRLVQTLYLTSSTTFTKATYPWLRAIRVKCQAGGGGAGGAGAAPSGQVVSGKAGAGGVYAESFITDIAGLASSVAVTVGLGGAGGSAGNNSGATGGNSSFGSLVSASGGTAGGTADYTFPPNFPASGAPGPTSGVGDLVIAGGDGGISIALNSSWVKAGDGGSSFLSTFRTGQTAVNTVFNGAPGLAGKLYGGGGTPGINTSGHSVLQSGGAGANGIVILELYA